MQTRCTCLPLFFLLVYGEALCGLNVVGVGGCEIDFSLVAPVVWSIVRPAVRVDFLLLLLRTLGLLERGPVLGVGVL